MHIQSFRTEFHHSTKNPVQFYKRGAKLEDIDLEINHKDCNKYYAPLRTATNSFYVVVKVVSLLLFYFDACG